MFSPGELDAMTAIVAETLGTAAGLGDEIVIHRGRAVLPGQPVRLVRPGGIGGRSAGTDGTGSEQVDVSIVGLPTLDIRPGDRFNVGGNTYEVTSLHPQRQIDTVAQARLVQ